MSTDFVPFLPLAGPLGSARGFEPKILQSGSSTKPAIQPAVMGDGRPEMGAGHERCEPRVTVERTGDKVTRIQVHCNCGQVIELSCVY